MLNAHCTQPLVPFIMDELLEGIELNIYNMGTKQCSAATYINYGQVGNP